MDGVVVLEPGGELPEDRDGVRTGVHPDVVALDGFDEGLADAVALGTADRREAGSEVRRRWPNMLVILTSGYSQVLANGDARGFELLHNYCTSPIRLRAWHVYCGQAVKGSELEERTALPDAADPEKSCQDERRAVTPSSTWKISVKYCCC
jgi:hypothetical protein